MEKIRILIADDHTLVREGTRERLEREDDFEVVGEAADGEEAVRLTKQLKPNVAIIDIAMPNLNGIEATKRIKTDHPSTAVLVLSAYDNDQYIYAVLEAGANGYLLKNVRGHQLVDAIRDVRAGEVVLDPHVARKVVQWFSSLSRGERVEGLPEHFSERELDVLKLAAKGMSNKEIAAELSLSVRTVQSHLGNIFDKLGVSSRTEAVLRALKEGWISLGGGPPLKAATRLNLRLAGSQIQVEEGEILTARSHLTLRGTLYLEDRLRGRFSAVGPVDLHELDSHLWRTGLGIEGAGHYDGDVEVEGPRLKLRGLLSGTAGVLDGVPVPLFSGPMAYDERGFVLQGLRLHLLSGVADIDLHYPPGANRPQLAARFEGVDAEGAARAIFDLGPMGVGSGATGSARLDWPKGHFRELSGSVECDLSRVDDGRTPLSGRLEWTATDGDQTIGRGLFSTPTTSATVTGRIDRHDRLALGLDLESSDLAAADDLSMRLRRSLGNLGAMTTSLAGRGVFHGRCGGTLTEPVFEGRLTGHDVGYLGVVWGDAEWVGRLTPLVMDARSLVVRRPDAELWLDGRLDTGEYGDQDRVDTVVRLRAWPAEDLARALRWDVAVVGPVSGEAVVRGRRSAPQGIASLAMAEGLFYGLPFRDLDVRARLRGRTVEIPRGRARVGEGEVVFHGSATDDEAYDVAVSLRDVDLTAARPAALRSLPISGQLSGEASLQGTLTRPRLKGDFESPRLKLAGVDLGLARLALRGTGTAAVVTGVFTGRQANAEATIEGRVATSPPYDAQLRASARDLDATPWLRTVWPKLPVAIGLATTGTAELRGPLARPRDVALDLDLSEIRISLPDYPLRNRDPVRLALRDGRLECLQVRFSGEGTHLECHGGADLTHDEGPIALSLSGSADLRALTALTERVRGHGSARIQVDVRGQRRAPTVDGVLGLDRAGLRFRGFPHGLEDLSGEIRFNESGARLADATARLAGGDVEINGDAAFSGGRLSSFELRSTGRGLGLRYPEGLRSTIDADVRVAGDGERQWLTGDVYVRQALWTRRYDITADLFSGGAPRGPEESAAGLSYDVRVHAPGTLRVDNNLAALDAAAELQLVGTVDSPVVLGHADIERGRIYFRGNTYVIRRGAIEFADPHRTDPFFDIQAESSVRGYRVVLTVAGTLARVRPTLTSDPPLSPLQILTLLAGGDESSVASLTQAQRDQAYLAVTGAATLAAGRLSEQVGLERGAQRLLGLSRFSIDPRAVNPALAEGETATTARLTVGKRLTPDLSVLYTRDLGGKDEHLLSVEYTLSDRVSLLLTRSQRPGEEGEYGFDVLLRRAR